MLNKARLAALKGGGEVCGLGVLLVLFVFCKMRIVTLFYRHNGRTLLYRIFAGIYAIAREITPIVVFSLSFMHGRVHCGSR